MDTQRPSINPAFLAAVTQLFAEMDAAIADGNVWGASVAAHNLVPFAPVEIAIEADRLAWQITPHYTSAAEASAIAAHIHTLYGI